MGREGSVSHEGGCGGEGVVAAPFAGGRGQNRDGVVQRGDVVDCLVGWVAVGYGSEICCGYAREPSFSSAAWRYAYAAPSPG